MPGPSLHLSMHEAIHRALKYNHKICIDLMANKDDMFGRPSSVRGNLFLNQPIWDKEHPLVSPRLLPFHRHTCEQCEGLFIHVLSSSS